MYFSSSNPGNMGRTTASAHPSPVHTCPRHHHDPRRQLYESASDDADCDLNPVSASHLRVTKLDLNQGYLTVIRVIRDAAAPGSPDTQSGMPDSDSDLRLGLGRGWAGTWNMVKRELLKLPKRSGKRRWNRLCAIIA
eukprot:3185396-Rhodomonas_salina.1